MQINVRYLNNLRLEALFDDFSVIADQPIRYKGDGSAPGPFDYFLASSALCAAYFVKVYCNARDIPTEDIKLVQNNIIDPENRYKHTIKMELYLPDSINEKDKAGMIKAMDRCSVKRVIQNSPEFIIEAKAHLEMDIKLAHELRSSETLIAGKDRPLEDTIKTMTKLIADLGIKLEIASWRNIVPHVWSVHVRDADSPLCYTNGKGSTKDAALCSALGEYLERISNNYFYNDFYLGPDIANAEFVHYPEEKWFTIPKDNTLPAELMDENLKEIYHLDGELKASHLVDTNSGNTNRGICALPFTRQTDQKTVYIPVNLIGNLFVSNGMSAGNTKFEARVQCLSEIFERAVKKQIITEEITLPTVPRSILNKYPAIMEGIEKLESEGFPVIVKDASLGGVFPVICVALMIPETGGVFASFGAHPKFEVALERSLTELLQGRSFEGLKELPPPSFNQFSVTEHNNIVDHFVDSTGVISWKFFSAQADFSFNKWNFIGSTEEEFHYLMSIVKDLKKEVYITDYDDLGTPACRILIPGYSEIYEAEDLIWDNHNQALLYREDILNLHQLNDTELESLLDRLTDSELEEYMPIGDLVGMAFDENSVWGQLVIGELKCLISLALKDFESAKEFVDMFLAFNDNSTERRKFYQALNVSLDITLNPDLAMTDYQSSLIRMYGQELITTINGILTGEIRFYGLTPTDIFFKGQEKHLKLIESYLKLCQARSR